MVGRPVVSLLVAAALLAAGPLARLAQAQATTAVDAPTSSAPAAKVVVRLFLDLQCPHTRRAWPLYRDAVTALPAGLLVLHHFPLSRHPLAHDAAMAALAARTLGKELAFVDAVLSGPAPDAAALQAAASAAGIQPAAFAAALAKPALASALEREQQAVAAMGIRATPSALIGGRGLAGVPDADLLPMMLGTAAIQAQAATREAGRQADTEWMTLARATPDFVPAFEQLRALSAGPAAATAESRPDPLTGRPTGLGEVWRLVLPEKVPQRRPTLQMTHLVVWLDPTSATSTAQAQRWAQWSRSQSAVGLVWLPQVTGPGAGQLAHQLAAAALLDPNRAGQALELVTWDGTADMTSRWTAALQRAGLTPAQLQPLLDKPLAAEWLQHMQQLAARVDAQPGAVYFGGHRWWGQPGPQAAAALKWLLNEIRQPCKSGPPGCVPPADALANGKVRDPAEADLDFPLRLAGLDAWPALAQGGPEVTALLDLSSMHSRAAWYMLRRTVEGKPLPTTLRVAVLAPAKGSCRSKAGDAVLAATKLGIGRGMVDALLDSPKPADVVVHEKIAQRLGIASARWKAALADQAALDAAALPACKLRKALAHAEEPVILIGGRPYTGALDEARLERAARHVARQPRTPAMDTH
jgi:protein-disulfide isomerase